jgi:catalase
MRNPKGRANYQPNSWGAEGGPRANPTVGFRSFAEPVEGNKVRLRPESFADHYSQARQFFISQTPIEQNISVTRWSLSSVRWRAGHPRAHGLASVQYPR